MGLVYIHVLVVCILAFASNGCLCYKCDEWVSEWVFDECVCFCGECVCIFVFGGGVWVSKTETEIKIETGTEEEDKSRLKLIEKNKQE